VALRTPAPQLTPEQQKAALEALQAQFQAQLAALTQPPPPPPSALSELTQAHTDLVALRSDLHRRLQKPNAVQPILEDIIDAVLLGFSATDAIVAPQATDTDYIQQRQIEAGVAPTAATPASAPTA
jgi:hypothetical protein